MRGRSPLALFMLGAFVTGATLMVLFEATITRVFGMGALVAFMASGLFLVASPEMLEPDESRHDHQPPRRDDAPQPQS